MREKILDLLVCQRLEVIEDAVNKDEEYHTMRKEQIRLQETMESMGLTKEQREIVQELLDKANQSGAVYGKIAFQQGFRDGAEFMRELTGKN